SAKKQADGTISMVVSDNGIGLPKETRIDNTSDTLGFRLIINLASQLDASYRCRNGNGTTWEINFNSQTAKESRMDV
ncbi:MAG: hypothetical protein OEY01_02230, partial [Desulfobulbaceae bacterium]|nr:hypothetical protein [Desulfobulbaceae bacterium]HIJ78111.1 hypothetical protein [Deltaproteobacteria bacterium]